MVPLNSDLPLVMMVGGLVFFVVGLVLSLKAMWLSFLPREKLDTNDWKIIMSPRAKWGMIIALVGALVLIAGSILGIVQTLPR